MNITKSQAIHDLKIETIDNDLQNQVVAQFFTLLLAKIRLALVNDLSEEQTNKLDSLSGNEQFDGAMDDLLGDDFSEVVNTIYRETVKEFIATTESFTKGINSSTKQ